MKIAKTIAVALLALCSLSASAAGKKVFADPYLPPGCRITDKGCFNPYNERFMAAWAKGDAEAAKVNCRNIDDDHVPALPMPAAYEFCAQSGDVRSIGKYASWLGSTGKFSGQVVYMAASKGMIVLSRGVPHPDSFPAFATACDLDVFSRIWSDAVTDCYYAAMSGEEQSVSNYERAKYEFDKNAQEARNEAIGEILSEMGKPVR